jgi:hypothetical protein
VPRSASAAHLADRASDRRLWTAPALAYVIPAAPQPRCCQHVTRSVTPHRPPAPGTCNGADGAHVSRRGQPPEPGRTTIIRLGPGPSALPGCRARSSRGTDRHTEPPICAPVSVCRLRRRHRTELVHLCAGPPRRQGWSLRCGTDGQPSPRRWTACVRFWCSACRGRRG